MAVMSLFPQHLTSLSLPANKAVCINAATMALIDAGIAMKDFVCACSSSLIEDTTVVGMNLLFSLPFIPLFSDLNYLEESARGHTVLEVNVCSVMKCL